VAVPLLFADSEELFARVGRLGGERGSAKQDEEKEVEFHGERIAGRVGGSDSAGTNTPQRLKPAECLVLESQRGLRMNWV
jgi:hypothetical protein